MAVEEVFTILDSFTSIFLNTQAGRQQLQMSQKMMFLWDIEARRRTGMIRKLYMLRNAAGISLSSIIIIRLLRYDIFEP